MKRYEAYKKLDDASAKADGLSRDLQRAAEAIGDGKAYELEMLPLYSHIEERVEAAIAEKWSIDFEKHHDLIKQCDHEMLVAEKNALITNAETFVFEGQSRIEAFPFCPGEMPPSKAKAEFLKVFKQVIKARKQMAVP